jgi:peptide deformylase
MEKEETPWEEQSRLTMEQEADKFIEAITPNGTKIVTDRATLLKKSRPVTKDDDVEGIVKQLKAANDTAWTKGCGLAAIQIGIPIRLAYISYEGIELVLINPVIGLEGPYIVQQEGCLSIPNRFTSVRRARKVRLYNRSIDRELMPATEHTGFIARVIQHEIDHMDGILNVEKAYVPLKLGRNAPCYCGSLKKYKHCCL